MTPGHHFVGGYSTTPKPPGTSWLSCTSGYNLDPSLGGTKGLLTICLQLHLTQPAKLQYKVDRRDVVVKIRMALCHKRTLRTSETGSSTFRAMLEKSNLVRKHLLTAGALVARVRRRLVSVSCGQRTQITHHNTD